MTILNGTGHKALNNQLTSSWFCRNKVKWSSLTDIALVFLRRHFVPLLKTCGQVRRASEAAVEGDLGQGNLRDVDVFAAFRFSIHAASYAAFLIFDDFVGLILGSIESFSPME